MDLHNGDCGVHGLGEGILEEADVGPSHNACVMGVELYVDDFWWWEPAMVMDVGRRIFTGVSVVASMAYEL